MRVDAVVIGAGWAGLGAALALDEAGLRPVVLEAGERVGGKAATLAEGDWRVETGPQTIRGAAPALDWAVQRLGVGAEVRPVKAGGRRYLWRRGRLVRVPPSPLAILRGEVIGRRAFLRALCEHRVRGPGPDEESVHDFFARRFGAEVAEVLVGAFVAGIHAGDPRALEMRSAFPTVWALEREFGSVMGGGLRRALWGPRAPRRGLWGFAGGMETFNAAAHARFGDAMRLREPVVAVAREGTHWRVESTQGAYEADKVVVCCPPAAGAKLLGRVDAVMAGALSGIGAAPIAVAHLGGVGPSPLAAGFGALVPPGEPVRALGALFPSNLYADRTPEGGWLASVFLGGRRDPTALQLDAEALASLAREDLAKILGKPIETSFERVIVHAEGIPQLERGHATRLAAVAEGERARPGLALGGGWREGVSVDAALGSGRAAALRVCA